MQAMPMHAGGPPSKEEFGPPHHSTCPKMSGGKTPITYDESNFRPRYLDEYTGEVLQPSLIRAAIEDELNHFNSKVWELCTIDEMKQVPDYILVRSRWVLCNKRVSGPRRSKSFHTDSSGPTVPGASSNSHIHSR